MRFLLRSLLGLALFASAIGVVAWGALSFIEARGARDGGPSRKAGTERVFAVDMGVIENATVHPRITAYGDIRSWRSLELRATSGGYIVELSDRFRDGERVAKGDVLFRMDPEDAEDAVADARAALDEAEADLAEAKQAVAVAAQELVASETQRDLRGNALERREGLRSRGVSTAAEVEEAEMAFAASEQTVASREQMLLAAEVKIQRSELRVQRAEIALKNAERNLADTTQRAPFSGLLSGVSAVMGGLATPNERLGVLIDPTALEAAFRVTNAQYARLLDANGSLQNIPVEVSLELDEKPVTTIGVIERAGAEIGAGETGRLIYARLDLDDANVFRPGDFVTVAIDEPPISGVAELPASAVTEDGELLIVGEDNRLVAAETRILRRLADAVVVQGAPDGARYVRERAPQLGAGIRVRPINPPAGAEVAAMIELDPERQQRLIGFVEDSQKMPTDMKVRVLGALRSGKAPADMVERIEARMGESG